jgi:thioredoxin 1
MIRFSAALFLCPAGVATALLLAACEPAGKAVLPAAESPRARSSPETGVDQVETARRRGRPTVVEFGAAACAGCREMIAVMREVEPRVAGRAQVLVLDVMKERELLRAYGIRVIPTQVYFDARGQEAKRHVGVMTVDAVVEQLTRLAR